MATKEPIIFEGMTATVAYPVPLFFRITIIWLAGIAGVTAITPVVLVMFLAADPWTQLGKLGTWVVCALMFGGVFITMVRGMPDRRIVLDAEAQDICIFEGYPWRPERRVKVVQFAAVRSIGVERIDAGEADTYAVVLRLGADRSPIHLWNPPFPEKAEQALQMLTQLTGLVREDRL
jgi:hypothetical protein